MVEIGTGSIAVTFKARRASWRNGSVFLSDKHGHNGDGSDDDDLPPLRDILSGMKPKGVVENGALSLKRRILTQQPVAASGLRGDPAKADAGTGAANLEPSDSEGGYFTFWNPFPQSFSIVD